MSPLDKESIHFKVARIRKNLKELKRLGAMSYKEYIQGYNTSVAERLLHVSIEAMLDIGSHIVAQEGLGEPVEYRDIFVILTQAKITPPAKRESYLNMVGLRNRIVHVYEDIDHKLIHKFLRKNLGDIEEFVRVIARYLK